MTTSTAFLRHDRGEDEVTEDEKQECLEALAERYRKPILNTLDIPDIADAVGISNPYGIVPLSGLERGGLIEKADNGCWRVTPKVVRQTWAELCRAVKAGATAGKVAATVGMLLEYRDDKTGTPGTVTLFDSTGDCFSAVLSPEGLAQYRDVLVTDAAVLLMLAGAAWR